jgi:hypothetical protein
LSGTVGWAVGYGVLSNALSKYKIPYSVDINKFGVASIIDIIAFILCYILTAIAAYVRFLWSSETERGKYALLQ